MDRDLKDNIKSTLMGDQLVRFTQGLGITLHRAGREYKFLCPFHDDKKPSMCLNPEKGIYKCFSCGVGGDVFEFVERYRGIKEFPDVIRYIAAQIGMATDGKRVKVGEVQRSTETERASVEPKRLSPIEVLEHLDKFRANRLDSAEWIAKLGPCVNHAALEMLGGCVAPYGERVVLVVPMRDHEGTLISLRFRCFETKKRWSLATYKYINGQREIDAGTSSGIMAAPEFFEAERCTDYSVTMIVEGETDLLAGMSMMIGRYGTDMVEWPAVWAGLPGVGSCHEMVIKCPIGKTAITFFDPDQAGFLAVFDHHRMREVRDAEGNRTGMEKDLAGQVVPGMLTKLKVAGVKGIAAFPKPKIVDGNRKKVDLRDMVNAGTTWDEFREYCMRSGTVDPRGTKMVQEARRQGHKLA